MTDYAKQHLARRISWTLANQTLSSRRRRKNHFFHSEVNRIISSQIAKGSVVVDVGCSDGATLAACSPSLAIGIEIDESALSQAQNRLPNLVSVPTAVENVDSWPHDRPDFIILSMVLDEVYDAQSVLRRVAEWSSHDTRVVITTYSRLWRPLIRIAEFLKLKTRPDGENYLPWDQVENLLELEHFEVTKRLEGVLIPFKVPLVSRFVNRWLAPLPVLRFFCLVHVTTARLKRQTPRNIESVGIIVAARNESGHIAELIERVPILAPRQELIFVEGGSSDDTWEVIQRACREYAGDPRMTLRACQQRGKGKGDAVREGFARATSDVLLILDADISVPPEELPRFIEAIRNDACEFANGSRLVYPMDEKAMRLLNLVGNRCFSYLFTYLLGQPVRDTLCGTKVLTQDAYRKIAANRHEFGDFDPFGDFDLLFGASLLGLKIRDIPVHYKERVYGETNISRFSSGWMLLRMSRVAAKRLKFVG